MSLYTRVRDYFSPPKLRNKPGGLAWIKSYAPRAGCDEFAGSIVRTVRLKDGSFWLIEPPVSYTAKCSHNIPRDELYVPRGARVVISALCDELLVPIEAPGDGAQDESLRYLPPVPTRTPETA